MPPSCSALWDTISRRQFWRWRSNWDRIVQWEVNAKRYLGTETIVANKVQWLPVLLTWIWGTINNTVTQCQAGVVYTSILKFMLCLFSIKQLKVISGFSSFYSHFTLIFCMILHVNRNQIFIKRMNLSDPRFNDSRFKTFWIKSKPNCTGNYSSDEGLKRNEAHQGIERLIQSLGINSNSMYTNDQSGWKIGSIRSRDHEHHRY